MSNAEVLSQIGEALYGGRWKTDLAGDLGLSARMLRLYAAGSQVVPDAVVERARGLARTRADRLLALAGDALPTTVTSSASRRPSGRPLDVEEYVRISQTHGNRRPAGMAQRTWEARCAKELRVWSRETGAPLLLKGVETFRMQLWSDDKRLKAFDIRTEAGRSALRDLTLDDQS